MKNISLTEKLIVYFVVLCILSIGSVSFFAYRNAEKALIERTLDQLISIREVKRNRVESFFNDRIRDLNLLAASPAIKQKLKNNKSSDLFTDDISGKNLFNYIVSNQFYTSIYIGKTSEDFTIYPALEFKRYFTPGPEKKIKDIPAFRRLSKTNKIEVIDFPNLQSNDPSLLFCCAVRDIDDSIIGFLGLQVSAKGINDIMYENDPSFGFGKTGDFYIVGNDFLMRTQSRFIPNSIMNTSVKTLSVINAFEGKKGATIINDYRKIPVLSAYQKMNIPDLSWVIIAEIDLKEAMIPIYKIRNQLLMMALIIISIIFVIAFFVSNRITSPIIRLKKASEQIASGNLNLNLKVSANDEIGALTTSFNNMAGQLKEQSEKIKIEQLNAMKAMFDGQDMERQRLSRELHDGLGQELIAMKLKLEGIDDKATDYRKSVKEVKQLVDNTVDNIRSISNDLMPAILEEFGLATAIRYLCESVPPQSGLKIKFISSGNSQIHEKRVNMYLYRIAQEAITNIIKHSSAKSAEISILQHTDTIKLKISDAGKGFDMKCIQAGICRGLRNMRERVNILNGEIFINSQITKGTTIDINIPLSSEQKNHNT